MMLHKGCDLKPTLEAYLCYADVWTYAMLTYGRIHEGCDLKPTLEAYVCYADVWTYAMLNADVWPYT